MKSACYIFFLLCFAASVSAQQLTLFEKDGLGISFFADAQWIRSADIPDGIELVNQNHNLHVRMTEIHSSASGEDFLTGVLQKEGLAIENESFEVIVDGQKSLAVIGQLCEMRRPVKVLLIAIAKEDGYYLVRFKCPAECFSEHRKLMSELISSIRLVNTTSPFELYASYNINS